METEAIRKMLIEANARLTRITERLETALKEVEEKPNERSVNTGLLYEVLDFLKEQELSAPINKFGRWFKFYKCPRCDRTFMQGETPNYCPNCGKALCWNDIEKKAEV